MRLLGLDPGLARTGWGLIQVEGARLAHLAHGTITTRAADPLPVRLATLHRGLGDVLAAHPPDAVAVEEVFQNRNPQSTLKLGEARGVALLAAGLAGLPLHELAAGPVTADAADALAVAIAAASTLRTRAVA
ncbi:MAG: crossover junction endodeoxyribonuclease RuvC [Sphingomonadaceae bacterium]